MTGKLKDNKSHKQNSNVHTTSTQIMQKIPWW